MQNRKRVMLLVATALSSGVTFAACSNSPGVIYIPPDGGDASDGSPNDVHQGGDVLGVIDAGIVADVQVTDATDDASDAPSE